LYLGMVRTQVLRRARPLHGGGQGFESAQLHSKKNHVPYKLVLLCPSENINLFTKRTLLLSVLRYPPVTSFTKSYYGLAILVTSPARIALWLAVGELSMEPEIKLLCSLETIPS
jgi:hypothetical protein